MPEAKALEELDPRTVRILRLTPAERNGAVLAHVSVEFGYRIVHGVRLMRRADGSTWLGMPGQKNAGGEWRDTCFVPARAARDRLREAVLEAYQAKSHETGQSMAAQNEDCTPVPQTN